MQASEWKKIAQARDELLRLMARRDQKGRPEQGRVDSSRLAPNTVKSYLTRQRLWAAKKQAELDGLDEITFRTRLDLNATRSAVLQMHSERIAEIADSDDYEQSKALLKDAKDDLFRFNELGDVSYEPRDTEEKAIARLARFERKRPNWRQELDRHIERSKHWPGYLVMRITGCRPEELQKGILVERDQEGFLLHVYTAKGKKREEGIEERMRVIRSDDPRLAAFVGQVVRDDKNAFSHAFRFFMRYLGAREFSPYILRYAVSADLKAAGVGIAERAEYLGHQNDETVGRYSRSLSSKVGRERPAKLERARVRVKARELPGRQQDITQQDATLVRK